MSLIYIAWRSLLQRGLASLLTSISMALGVLLMVVVLTIHGVVSESFRNNSSLGYNMIVGANKGGRLQITLNTVFYLSQPADNIPYDFFLEFQGPETRAAEFKHSLARQSYDARWNAADLEALASASVGLPGISALGSELSLAALAAADERRMGHSRDGKFGEQQTALAIPVCLGDYLGKFRVVGTTPAMFDKLSYGADFEKKFTFREGRNFEHNSREHGYFEAVLGSMVARELGYKIGDEISPRHGGAEGHEHEQKFTVVGILAPSGTPNDRAAFVNMEGFYLMEDHAKPVRNEEGEEIHTSVGGKDPLPVEQREVTAILVRTTNPMVAMGIKNRVNEGNVAQAVQPIAEIFSLFELIVRPIQTLLLALTGMICLVSGISILVSIYNSMSDRRHEIAVMRALGAGRFQVMGIILLESIMLSLGGGALGWAGAHVLNALASQTISDMTGVTIGFFSFAPAINVWELFSSDWKPLNVWPELLLVPGLVLLAAIVGLLPAVSAYRTDVAKSLGV